MNLRSAPPIVSEERALQLENQELRRKLEEAEQTLNAIHEGGVDALVVAGPNGDNVFTLSGSDQNYRLLVESIGEGAITAASDGSILYCNTKFADMVGAQVETIVGCNIVDFVRTDEKSELKSFLLARNQKARKRETTLISKFGKEVSCQVSIGQLDAEGLNGISIIVTDLTKTKMAAALMHANDELEKKAADLGRSNAELERFAYVASHDLKEPLRVVRTHLQVVQRKLGESLDSGSREHMDFAMEAAQRMYDLIDDLLDYARIGAPKESLAEVDFNHIVAETLRSLDSSIEDTGAKVKVEPLPKCRALRLQMTQLFQNLIGNALKFRGEDMPVVEVSAGVKDRECVFSVKDNGIGIAPEYSSRVFEIFQRLHDRGEYPGTGIGLAICKKIVEQHGGRIWVESQPGAGAEFLFTLPLGKFG